MTKEQRYAQIEERTGAFLQFLRDNMCENPEESLVDISSDTPELAEELADMLKDIEEALQVVPDGEPWQQH